MIVRTNLLRRAARDLYRAASFEALDDPTAPLRELAARARKIRRAYRNDLRSIDNVELIARTYH